MVVPRLASCVACCVASCVACCVTGCVAIPVANGHADGVAVAVFPELTLSGYSLEDILLQDSLLDAVESALADLVTDSADLLPVLVVVVVVLVVLGSARERWGRGARRWVGGMISCSHLF